MTKHASTTTTIQKADRFVGHSLERGSGVVSAMIHGTSGALIPIHPSDLREKLKSGLAIQELEDLRAGLDIPMERLITVLGISKSTLHRRRTIPQNLSTEESDRVVRIAKLLSLAVDALESEELGRQWMTTSQIGLGGAVPLEYADTEVGAREVEDLLGRIEYSVYS